MNKTKEVIAEEIVEYIAKTTALKDLKDIPLNESLVASGIIDSFGVMEIIEFLENQFSITITDNDISIDNLGSINNMSEFVEKKILSMNF